jgi:hypothetical protein
MDANLYHFLANYVVGAIDFVDRVDKNINRCPKLPWWERFLGDLRSCQELIRVYVQKPTIERTKRWLKRQVAVRLEVMRQGMGDTRFLKFISDLCKDGEERMKAFDWALVDEIKNKYSDCIHAMSG